MKALIATIPGILLFALAGCMTPAPTIETPEGFARFEDVGEPSVISPDGVVLRIRTVPNKPSQNLEFW
ncbi:MAG: hypothetical protein E4H09_00785 [Spirochaetales bacterium]|nr:MAG: hypothetical protein E4H09_00785 [Spirochaetales bacterium]